MPQETAYLLHKAPEDGKSRTGHAAFVILKPGFKITSTNIGTLDDSQISYFFSMYHSLKPSEARNKGKLSLALHGLPAATVSSYETDLIMRGQTIYRYSQGDKENIGVNELVKALLERKPEKWQEYAALGQYDSFVALPEKLDIAKTIASLEKIKKTADWGMFAPAPSYALHKQPVENCCSAIAKSLKAGGIDIDPSHGLIKLPTTISISLWAAYFTTIALSVESTTIQEEKTNLFMLLPMIYAAHKLANSLSNGQQYFHDLREMEHKPKKNTAEIEKREGPKAQQSPSLPAYVVYTINSLCLITNVAFFLATQNAMQKTFLFPSSLFTAVKKVKGAEVENVNRPSLT